MRAFAQVPPTTWQSEVKKLRGDTDAIAVYFHLLTSQHSSMIGVYPLAVGYMAHDLGIPSEGASKGLQRVCDSGLATYDQDRELVCVHNMAAAQIATRLAPKDNKVVSVGKQLELLPICPITLAFYEKWRDLYHLKTLPILDGFERAFQGASEGLRSKDKDKEQNKEQNLEEGKGDSCSRGKEETYPHARENDEQEFPFDPSRTLEEARLFIQKMGVPPAFQEMALQRQMRGVLYNCDIENWKMEARGAA
ncbi:hypothetical protein FOB41_07515 [Agrobacterium pusense]|uniref:Uncharacterized protein n=1 Tax=Agrobacterium pusense TaxID=648995 RepID=A0A6H0ZK04_9HYPH|nr:hypothetical protein [Agrobacterium pusense]QIX20989.1 hypothetical protein FOB41_07515 [Agrobacterium pusense]